jgi:malonyl-CoA O-methyltransferase
MNALPVSADLKDLIADAFSKAAASYDGLACVQQTAGLRLLDSITQCNPAHILDIGCGSGWMSRHLLERFPQASLWALDLAPGMIHYVREHNPDIIGLVQADMEFLPFKAASFDLLYSNFAMQWLDDPAEFFRESYRLLKPGGMLCCTTLLPGTLHELQMAWAAADSRSHVNRFLAEECVLQAARQTDFSISSVAARSVVYYETVFAVVRALKGIGASTLNTPRSAGTGLAGRRSLLAMQQGYERFRCSEGIPATYEILYCVLTRPAGRL